MKSLLARIAFRRAVGLYLGEHQLAVSLAAATPLGPVEVLSSSEPCASDEIAGVIDRLLVPLVGRKCRVPVAVGLPCGKLFYSTRLVVGGNDYSPSALMRKALFSTNISVDELVVDMLPGTINKHSVASLAACRKKYMSGIVGSLAQCGVRPLRAEPAACALLRVAAEHHRAPRRSKSILRVCLGPSEAMAAIVSGGMPLCWRSFPLPAGSECFAILSAVRTLQTQTRHLGLEATLDYVIIQGRVDLHARLEKEGLPSEIGIRVLWSTGPEMTAATIAYGLALGCLTQNMSAFDLSRHLKPRASLREIFPFGELACQTALIVVMGLLLAARSDKLGNAYSMADAERRQNKLLATAKPGELDRQKKDLSAKLQTIHDFLDSRVLWTEYFQELADTLPENTQLNQFQGMAPLTAGKKKQGSSKKSLVLQAQAALLPDGSVPREVGEFLVSLPKHPLLKRDFPDIRVTNIKPSQANNRSAPSASFAVTCLVPDKKAAKGDKKAGDEQTH